MNCKDDSTGKLVLASSTWLSLIALVAGGIAANLGLIYTQSSGLQSRIDALDERWQKRIVVIAAELRKDTAALRDSIKSDTNNLRDSIKSMEQRIPPDWFRSMVERNTIRIDKLEDECRKNVKP